jgi:hypothetical protein
MQTRDRPGEDTGFRFCREQYWSKKQVIGVAGKNSDRFDCPELPDWRELRNELE